MDRAPDGFPGCLLLWREVLRRELRLLWHGSARVTCPEHLAGGGWEPGTCEGCPLKEECQ
jgi:hypothetical protein